MKTLELNEHEIDILEMALIDFDRINRDIISRSHITDLEIITYRERTLAATKALQSKVAKLCTR